MSFINPKSHLLKAIRKSFLIALESEKTGIPLDELLEKHKEHSISRRKALKDLGKTGIAIAGLGLLEACTKNGIGAIDANSGITGNQNAAGKPSTGDTQSKIVIVGAGMAGLNCAYQLSKAGYASTIYESSSRLGGRIFTKSNIVGNGVYAEMGGEFIDSIHTDMINLCQEFNLPLMDTETPFEAQLDRDDFYINGSLYNESQIIQAFQPYAKQIAADIRLLPNTITYYQNNSDTIRFDNMSIAAYFDSIGMTGWIRKGLELAYCTEYGREVNEQTAINFLYLFNPDTNKGFQIFGASDERYKIQGGNSLLTNAIAQRLPAGNIIYENRLVQIDPGTNGSGYSLTFKDANNTSINVKADILVLTLPFSILRNVKITVPLPAVKNKSINTLGYGTNSKLFMGFNARVWRNFNNSGYIYTDSTIQTGWDASWLQSGNNGCFTVFQGGNAGLQLAQNSPEYWAKKSLTVLDSPGLWPGASRSYIQNSAKTMNWPSNSNALGSYTCWLVGQATTIGGAEIQPVGNMFFAGEHCSLAYQGYMNGAAETGRIAANNVVQAIKSK